VSGHMSVVGQRMEGTLRP